MVDSVCFALMEKRITLKMPSVLEGFCLSHEIEIFFYHTLCEIRCLP